MTVHDLIPGQEPAHVSQRLRLSGQPEKALSELIELTGQCSGMS